MRHRLDWAVLVALTAVAAYFVFAWSSKGARGIHPVDTYYYYYPNMVQVARAFESHGRGLLWNAYQSCGQPFFGISSVGALYPASVFFLLFDPDVALRLVIAFNLTVAGVSAYLLCRGLGLRILSAFCGALAFAYGNASLNQTSWTPLVSGSYAWLPLIVLGCERILRAPSTRRALWLALVIAVALLPGFPQTVFFAYQLIALRVLWELGCRRLSRPWATLGALALAMVVPVLLIAVQLLPGMEMAQLSVRSGALPAQELGGGLSWESLSKALAYHNYIGNPVMLLPWMMASCCLVHRSTRRVALFYALAGLLYLVLAFGPNTPLFALYIALPLGNLFRMPIRFLWITGLCVAILTAFGVEALVPRPDQAPSWRRAIALAALPLVALLALDRLFPYGFTSVEWAVALAAIVAIVIANALPRLRQAAGATIAAAVASNLLLFPFPEIQSLAMRPFPLERLLPEGQALAAPAPAFAELRTRLTANDRVYVAYANPGMGRGTSIVAVGPKVAGVFGVPAIHDYEPQPAQRYASYYTLMRTGRPMRGLSDYYLQFEGMMPVGFKRRLLDLAAARYLVVEDTVDANVQALVPPPVPVWEGDGLRIYENTQALPRAFFVPHVEIVSDPDQLLGRLADGTDDLRRVAFVEGVPPSGFVGAAGDAAGAQVEFVTNDPEHVVLKVHAPAHGFVQLADQYFPGWTATVNGAAAEIMRANYLFRLVEVPVGDSVVEFRYRPRSLLLGASISALSVVGLIVALTYSRAPARRHRARRTSLAA